MSKSGDILDGYRLIRRIGEGGFGEVWLCCLEATGEYKALKFLSGARLRELERERQAVIRYRTAVVGLHSPYLLPIEHINRSEEGFYYTMPLSDGLLGENPEEEDWQPKTLSALIEQRKIAQTWFSSEEIRSLIGPLFEALQALRDVGVVHRDVKPENILFLNGRPCLGDVSLMSDDATFVTVRGTPGYAAPSWYLESGGDPDFWGISTTFYTLLTGNAPDKLGRPKYLWPPQGEASLSSGEVSEWKRLHGIIWRATHETAAERYRTFSEMNEALADLRSVAITSHGAFSAPVSDRRESSWKRRLSRGWKIASVLLQIAVAAFLMRYLYAVWWANAQSKRIRADVEAQMTESQKEWTKEEEENAKQKAALTPNVSGKKADEDQLALVSGEEGKAPAPVPISQVLPTAGATPPTKETRYFDSDDEIPPELEASLNDTDLWSLTHPPRALKGTFAWHGVDMMLKIDWLGFAREKEKLNQLGATCDVVTEALSQVVKRRKGRELMRDKIGDVHIIPSWGHQSLHLENGVLTIGVPFDGSSEEFQALLLKMLPHAKDHQKPRLVY